MGNLTQIKHKNQTVISTARLAYEYGTEPKLISNNFNRNKDRYVEGEHYYCLKGEEKLAFINNHQIEDSSKNSTAYYLWTEKGALLHAKSLNTDAAWNAYSILVDEYFRLRDIQPDAFPENVSPELQMFKLLYDGMVNQEIKVLTLEEKVNKLEENAAQNIQIPVLPASKIEIQAMQHIMKKDRISTTQLATRFGLSAQAFYRLLNTLGFVVSVSGDEYKGWELASGYAGKGIGANEMTIHNDNSLIYSFVQWTPKGRELIEEALKYNGIKPIRRLAPKKKHKKR